MAPGEPELLGKRRSRESATNSIRERFSLDPKKPVAKGGEDAFLKSGIAWGKKLNVS